MTDFSSCPRCRHPYSTQLPSRKHYSRCGLPLTLNCGHGCCYQCVVNCKDAVQHVSITTCSICNVVSTMDLDMVKHHLSSVVNHSLLGHLKWQEIELQLKAENIGFKDESQLLIPTGLATQQQNLERILACLVKEVLSSSHSTPTFCTSEHLHKERLYWCVDDEEPICAQCRLFGHARHNIVPITDKNKEQLDSFLKAAEEAVPVGIRLKETDMALKERLTRLEADHNAAVIEARRHFFELQTLLQSREQEVLQQLHHAFKERSKPLRNVERCFREALKDLNGTLEKAHRFLSAAGRGAIEHLTNRIEYFQHYVPALNVVADNLPHEAYQVQPVPVEDVLLKLRESAIMVICPIEALPQTPDWSSLEEDLQIVKIGMNALKAAPLSTGASINSDKPQFHPPAVVSQASECVAGMTVTARVLLNESSDVYYIRLLDDDEDNCFRPLNESLPDLGELKESGQNDLLNQLEPGFLVAVSSVADGHWRRALIEEVNHHCKDIVVFYIDYGDRELLTDFERIRYPSPASWTDIPARAIRCSLSPRSRRIIGKIRPVQLEVEEVVDGHVGRGGGHQEHTLIVTVKQEESSSVTADQESASSPAPPYWLLPAVQESYLEVNVVARNGKKPPKKKRLLDDMKAAPTSMSNDSRSSSSNSDACGCGYSQKHALQTDCEQHSSPQLILPPLPSKDQENRNRVRVLLTHRISPGHFYLRVLTETPFDGLRPSEVSYEDLTRQLAENSSQASPCDPTEVTEGLECIALLDSGDYQRCVVTKIESLADSVSVKLIDVGSTVTVPVSSLFHLDQRWSSASVPAMAVRCALWGLRPAGHEANWSERSLIWFTQYTVEERALYCRTYHMEPSSDGNDLVRMVRLYYEIVQPGGPLGCDEIKTHCVNDFLLEDGVVLKRPRSAVSPPEPPITTWPPCLTLPPELEAKAIWLDYKGLLYIHHLRGPSHHLEAISNLLNSYYAGSRPDAQELSHWQADEPCIARFSSDATWYRGQVLAADDDKKLATVLYVDYGNEEEVPYSELRRNLICFDYAVQAYRVRLAKFPGEIPPSPEEVEMLHDMLASKTIRMRIKYETDEELPVASNLKLVGDEAKVKLEEIFALVRPEKQQQPPPLITIDDSSVEDSSSPVIAASDSPDRPGSVVQQSTGVHSNDDGYNNDDDGYDLSAESDDSDLPFHFDSFGGEFREAATFSLMLLPAKVFLPVRLSSFNGTHVVVHPIRDSLISNRGVPDEWYKLADDSARLKCELQRSAPLFPEIQVADHGCPCACYCEQTGVWSRGAVVGYADDSLLTVRVELVDESVFHNLAPSAVKQLPMEFLSLPRLSKMVRLANFSRFSASSPCFQFIQNLIDCGTPLRAYFKITANAPIPDMVLYYEDSNGRFVPVVEI